jgi:hypothetical protein
MAPIQGCTSASSSVLSKGRTLIDRGGKSGGQVISLPILLKLTEGQAHDGRSGDDMLDSLGHGDVLLAHRA